MDPIYSIFELAAWLNIKPTDLWTLTKNENEPLPVYDAATMRFYQPDVIAWLGRWGLAAPSMDNG